MTPDQPHLMERAFQIARSGEARSFQDLSDRMVKEGYSRRDLMGFGPMTRRQLSRECADARKRAANV